MSLHILSNFVKRFPSPIQPSSASFFFFQFQDDHSHVVLHFNKWMNYHACLILQETTSTVLYYQFLCNSKRCDIFSICIFFNNTNKIKRWLVLTSMFLVIFRTICQLMGEILHKNNFVSPYWPLVLACNRENWAPLLILSSKKINLKFD